MTVYPAGQSNPATSNLNYAGRPVADQRVVPAGTGGARTVTNSARAKMDVSSIERYFVRGPAVAGGFVPVAARRVMDTRIGLGGPTPGRTRRSTCS